ncbi:NADPH-dependent FMN reductase [Amycolatopsis sp. H20-H5]|uniref:NADPH-dependent FMN reductase n=1 Tax=Amycolatopsis sp. H20-H5 TaxID=3046309 RepID=UPI002DB7C1ED|nr:NAD(P)H-dependent oxidoreductase [Amycolatopsis sp. H20-H5]MEC3975743.1 NAD(P)H-dependent oxidoreductase [Amycolatopsis sp. H20-H5]
MSEQSLPRVQVIVGSTRPGRAGLPVAGWIAERAEKHGGFEVEVLDLAELDLPIMNEPNHPRLRKYTHEHTKRWSETIERGDAYILVVPEYNHGPNAATKNALDYLVHEWAFKPVGLVSYGGVAGGTRAVAALKPTLAVLKMMPLTEGVIIPMIATALEGEGQDRRFVASAEIEAGAKAMLDELARVEPVLRQLRPKG